MENDAIQLRDAYWSELDYYSDAQVNFRDNFAKTVLEMAENKEQNPELALFKDKYAKSQELANDYANKNLERVVRSVGAKKKEYEEKGDTESAELAENQLKKLAEHDFVGLANFDVNEYFLSDDTVALCYDYVNNSVSGDQKDNMKKFIKSCSMLLLADEVAEHTIGLSTLNLQDRNKFGISENKRNEICNSLESLVKDMVNLKSKTGELNNALAQPASRKTKSKIARLKSEIGNLDNQISNKKISLAEQNYALKKDAGLVPEQKSKSRNENDK